MGIQEWPHFSDVGFTELAFSGGRLNGLNVTIVTDGEGCLWMLFSHQSGHVLTIHGTHEGLNSSFALKLLLHNVYSWAIMAECEFIFQFREGNLWSGFQLLAHMRRLKTFRHIYARGIVGFWLLSCIKCTLLYLDIAVHLKPVVYWSRLLM